MVNTKSRPLTPIIILARHLPYLAFFMLQTSIAVRVEPDACVCNTSCRINRMLCFRNPASFLEKEKNKQFIVGRNDRRNTSTEG